jgi:hypothetical protein
MKIKHFHKLIPSLCKLDKKGSLIEKPMTNEI